MPWTPMPEISATEVSPLLVVKKSRSYKILVDVSDARRKNIFPSTAH
jgi:hypothetical protein